MCHPYIGWWGMCRVYCTIYWNTCNVQFTDYYFMILRECFTSVRKVLTVLIHDGDLISIVEEMGITLIYPIDRDHPM